MSIKERLQKAKKQVQDELGIGDMKGFALGIFKQSLPLKLDFEVIQISEDEKEKGVYWIAIRLHKEEDEHGDTPKDK